MTYDELSSQLFGSSSQGSKASPDAANMRTALGGFETPEDYAIAHANWAGQEKAKASGGHYTIDELFKDIDTHYSAGLAAAQKERDRVLDLQKQQAENQLDIQKQETLKTFDVNKTRQPTDEERKEGSALAYSWNSLKDLQTAYNQARATAPAFTGPVGGQIANFVDDHGVTRGFSPDDIKKFNTQAAATAGPLLQGILQYTAGADAKTNVMQNVIPELMPSLTDDPKAFEAKLTQLQTAAARRVQAFKASREGLNAAGNPAVDLSSMNEVFQEPLQFLQARQKQAAQTTSTGTPNSVMTPETQGAYSAVRNAATRGTSVTPVPTLAPEKTQQPSPAPTPSPQATPQNPSDFASWMVKLFGGGGYPSGMTPTPSSAYGGT